MGTRRYRSFLLFNYFIIYIGIWYIVVNSMIYLVYQIQLLLSIVRVDEPGSRPDLNRVCSTFIMIFIGIGRIAAFAIRSSKIWVFFEEML